MGAAVGVEINKPVDASEIRESCSVAVAKAEIIRLRTLLGHLAQANGFEPVCLDASDLVTGVDDLADFERCVKEIAHIRRCLQLNTQNSRRVDRKYVRTRLPESDFDRDDVNNSRDSEDSNSSDDASTEESSSKKK